MPTKIVPSPISTLEEGVTATLRLAVGADVDGKTGVYFDGLRETRANEQAYDAAARDKLLALSRRLSALG